MLFPRRNMPSAAATFATFRLFTATTLALTITVDDLIMAIHLRRRLLGGNEVHLLEGSEEKREVQVLEESLHEHLVRPEGANFVNNRAGNFITVAAVHGAVSPMPESDSVTIAESATESPENTTVPATESSGSLTSQYSEPGSLHSMILTNSDVFLGCDESIVEKYVSLRQEGKMPATPTISQDVKKRSSSPVSPLGKQKRIKAE